uniref:Uncharacterized protein n=1 Tax=Caenorhabditis japonica TaxID=281687 RepID=A0A8R1ISW6_CAEJA
MDEYEPILGYKSEFEIGNANCQKLYYSDSASSVEENVFSICQHDAISPISITNHSTSNQSSQLKSDIHLTKGGGFVANEQHLLLPPHSPQSPHTLRTCQDIIDDRLTEKGILKSLFFPRVLLPGLLNFIIPDPLDLVAAAVGQSTAQAILITQV